MTKTTAFTIALVSAIAGFADDQSYRYTPGDTSLGDGAVEITYVEGTTQIATLVATPTDGGTITLTGTAPTFAAGATLTLAASGTVAFASKVTTKGALTLARGDNAYIVWTGESAMTENSPGVLVATGLTRNDIDFVALIPAASSADVRGPYALISGPDSTGFYLFNHVTASYVYSVRVQLTQENGNLYARCRTGLRSPRLGLYPDEEASWATESLWDKWARKDEPRERAYYGISGDAATYKHGAFLGSPSKLGFNKIILRRKGLSGAAKVRFGGGASFGGTTTIDAGVEAVLVASATESVTLNKSIAGDGDFTVVSPPNVANTATMLGYISHLEWKVLARNRSLKDVKKITGHMQGSAHNPLPTGIPGWCYGYFFTTNATGDAATCQFQCANSKTTYKYVSAQLKQEGPDILIKATGYGYATTSNSKPGDQERANQYSSVSYWDDDQGKYTSNGYGICDVTAYFDDTTATAYHGGLSIDYDYNGGDLSGLVGGKFTIDGSGSDLPMFVRVYSKTGFPYSGEVHVNDNSYLHLIVTNANNSTFISSSSANLMVHEGAIMRSGNYSWQLGGVQELVLAGGKYAPFSPVGHLNFVTLSNAVLQSASASGGLRFESNRSGASWRVIGDQPSAVTGAGANVYGASSAATARNNGYSFRVNVADVAEGVDFTVSKIRGAVDRASDRENYAWFMFEKYGRGTMALTGDGKEVRLASKLYGGTLLLAESNAMTNAVELLGGDIAVAAGKSNSLGALSATTNGTISVGAGGSLSFASFAPDAALGRKSVTIDAPMAGNALRFGSQLSAGQLKCFRWQDASDATKFWHVSQDDNGYLHPDDPGILVIIR
ncbi:MAG: hypothetical protein IKE55_04090 [Kiritimatiellae bacterium]|nr:hypothetical protein [Kiritimatiellia bacterium]